VCTSKNKKSDSDGQLLTIPEMAMRLNCKEAGYGTVYLIAALRDEV